MLSANLLMCIDAAMQGWLLPLQDIAMNGCLGVTEDVWPHVNAASNDSVAVVGAPIPLPQHALQSLSLVGCKALRSCLLGLRPAAGWDAASPVQPSGDWLAAACHLSGILLFHSQLDMPSVVTQSSMQALALSS